ncbi:MAG: tetratricopeptide repeat protein [Alphaproteobacteria bacterium]|nr:tetratricopeptide repeat protein [Alphaproteobacteria bacterium]
MKTVHRAVACAAAGFALFMGSAARAEAPPSAAAIEDLVYQCIEPLLDATYAPPIFSGLGPMRYPFEMNPADAPDAALAQTYFVQGMNLFYGFNHPEAALSFAEAAVLAPLDPMPYWGIALSVGPDINSNPDDPCLDVAGKTAAKAAAAAAAQCAAAPGLCAPGARTPERLELMLAEAIDLRYGSDDPEYARNVAYADAMAETVAAFPAEADAHVLYAAAQMDVCPWQWWLKPGQSDCEGWSPAGDDPTLTYASPRIEIAIDHIERAITLYPRHLGARHYHIHAVEESPTPADALETAEILAELGPGMGHIVHMPSHIYRRLGRHDLASLYNYRSVAVDAAYVAQVPKAARYLLHYLNHDRHFLMISLGFEGRRSETLSTADILIGGATEYAEKAYSENTAANLSVSAVKPDYFFTAGLWALARFSSISPLRVDDPAAVSCDPADLDSGPQVTWSTPYRYFLTRVGEGMDGLEGLSDRTIKFPMARLAADYTYLMGLAADPAANGARLLDCFAGRYQETEAAAARIAQEDARFYAGYGNNRAEAVRRLMVTTLAARIARRLAPGDAPAAFEALLGPLGASGAAACAMEEPPIAVALLEGAVALQDGLYYNEPDDWFYPVRESLGAAYLEAGRPDCALAVFQRDLEEHPRNPRSLFGLAETLDALGEAEEAERVRAEFRTVWRNSELRMTLAELR